jgi:hypothetical protein
VPCSSTDAYTTLALCAVCMQDTIKYATSIPRESVVDIRGIVKLAPTPIGSATQSLIEVHIEEVSQCFAMYTYIHVIACCEVEPAVAILRSCMP